MKVRAAVQAAKDSGICVLARTDCRPTAGIEEAVARIEMYVEEGADILFLDSPANPEEIARAIKAAKGKPSFNVVQSLGNPIPTAAEVAAMGFKIGTYPPTLLSPSIAGMKAGLAAMLAGNATAESALAPADHRETLGYNAYDVAAKPFIVAN
jgi:2-methylisocitrate lyase-like PEP mutase family enzyme